jgi:hypothetical protein
VPSRRKGQEFKAKKRIRENGGTFKEIMK